MSMLANAACLPKQLRPDILCGILLSLHHADHWPFGRQGSPIHLSKILTAKAQLSALFASVL